MLGSGTAGLAGLESVLCLWMNRDPHPALAAHAGNHSFSSFELYNPGEGASPLWDPSSSSVKRNTVSDAVKIK